MEKKKESREIYERLLNEINKERKFLERIIVNEGSHYFYVKTDDIVSINSCEKYVEIKTLNKSYLKRETIKNIEKHLDPSKFVRIHRFYIVNVDFIKEMQPLSHGDYTALMKNGEKLTISRRFRNRLFDMVAE